MKTIALYLRISSEDTNKGESNSISHQRDLLLDYVKSKVAFSEYSIIEFTDDGYSGAIFDRPALQKMLKLVGDSIDVVIVKDFSRFGRNMIEVGDYIDQVFPFLGVRFIAVTENYDSNDFKGSTASIDVGLKALVYEMYSRDLSQKIRAVQQFKFKNGEYMSSIPPFGYIRSTEKKNKLIANPETAPIIKRIFVMALDGMKPTQIAVVLNEDHIPSPYMYLKEKGNHVTRGWKLCSDTTLWLNMTIHRIITDERYTGKQISCKRTKIDISTKKTRFIPREDWIVCDNAHEEIISKKEWELAQKVVRPYLPKKNKITKSNILRELLICDHCGRTLHHYNNKTPLYRCDTRKFVLNCDCKDICISEPELKFFLLTSIHTKIQLLLSDNREMNTSADKVTTQITNINNSIKQIHKKQDILFEKLADDKITKEDYRLKNSMLLSQKSSFEISKQELACTLSMDDELQTTAQLKDLGKYAAVQTLTRELVTSLIQSIKVFPDNTIEIVWNFKEI